MQNKSNKPTISVIIPTYNRAALVREAIDSVLAQTYKNYEIIVIDDGSTDNTKEILEYYKDKIRYFYQENRGVSAARNTGIRLAESKYLAFLDSDDMWLPEKLEKQVEVLKKYANIALVYTNISYCDHTGKFLMVGHKAKMFPSGYIPEKALMLKAHCGSPPTWLIRKECFRETGFFDTELKMSEDRDMSLRIAFKYHIYGIAEPLVMVRQHTASLRLGTRSAKEREYYYFKFLEKLFKDTSNPTIQNNKKKLTAIYYFFAGRNYLSEKNLTMARNRFLLSIRNRVFELKVYPYLLVTLIGNNGFEILNKLRKTAIYIKIYLCKSIYPNKYSIKN